VKTTLGHGPGDDGGLAAVQLVKATIEQVSLGLGQRN